MFAISYPIRVDVSNKSGPQNHKGTTNILPLQQYFQKILFAFSIDHSVTELQTYLKTFFENKLFFFGFKIMKNFT